jgi:hypothetical protein
MILNFPREVNTQTELKEIHELRENDEISEDAKDGMLRANAARFYRTSGRLWFLNNRNDSDSL